MQFCEVDDPFSSPKIVAVSRYNFGARKIFSAMVSQLLHFFPFLLK